MLLDTAYLNRCLVYWRIFKIIIIQNFNASIRQYDNYVIPIYNLTNYIFVYAANELVLIMQILVFMLYYNFCNRIFFLFCIFFSLTYSPRFILSFAIVQMLFLFIYISPIFQYYSLVLVKKNSPKFRY